MSTNNKGGHPPPPRPSFRGDNSGNKQIVYTLFASAAAGIATWYYSFIHTPTSFTVLPASYALCADAGKIYTADPSNPTVDCIIVDKQTILTTGTLPQVQTWWDDYQNDLVNKWYGGEPSAKKPLPVINVRPHSIVVPGLADAHAHILQYGFKMQLPLDKARSLSQLLDTLEDYVHRHPSGSNTWIEAMGWDHTRWSDTTGAFPTAADIASRPALATLPIVLHRVDGHAIWISPRALELTKAHLGASFPETVPGGEILRDSSGEPTGIFLDAAQSLVPVPKWSSHQMREYAELAIKDALAVGLTSVHDAMTSVAELELFNQLESENKLPIRVYAMADTDRLTSADVKELEIYDRGPTARVRMRSVKVFTDGALGSWGAALLSPYSDKPEARGIMRYSEEELSTIVRGWWEKGWGVSIHAIGDRANKAVLDTFESIGKGLRDAEEVANRRPRIEHAQIMRVEDLERAGTLGVITSVQPTHATSDMNYAETRLGPERIKGAYAYQTLLKSSRHGILPLGSDFPVESINPLYGFYAAVSRLDREGNSPHGKGGWYPAERLTRAQALKGMTLDAAYAAFAEDVLGSLSAGKRADYVILDRDIMDETQPVGEILKAQVKATIVDGKVVYGGV
ncbi:hypothetical protein GSI_11674 [Ganoderma sinense ZZ0214-1]|uniref:Amidohydrolase 3 domain-containing protein n=1 Tax=Ganoderma sinense ZZ0214-1 TaxID=1077348 RepID=A0A2G8RWM9_9APHY|nr:hypothetical protein GSI_11674 [Ganoderma sinense ZZ0214-1]